MVAPMSSDEGKPSSMDGGKRRAQVVYAPNGAVSFVGGLATLPHETILNVLQYLGPRDVQSTASTCSVLRQAAISDAIWRPIVRRSLGRSPPIQSANLAMLENPPAPWDPSFGLISTGRNPATLENWFTTPQGGDTLDRDAGDNKLSGAQLLSIFPGAQSYHHIYWTFVRPYARLQGWWLGDVPSSGMAIRIVFDPAHMSLSADAGKPVTGPAFVCQKLHIVNRLHGMGRTAASRHAWAEAVGVAAPSNSSDGTSIELPLLSIDTSVPGVKTETLWAATWHDCRSMSAERVRGGRKVARIEWQGSLQPKPDNTQQQQQQQQADGSSARPANAQLGHPSIVSRARALASQLVFGHTQPTHPAQGQHTDHVPTLMDMETDDDDDDVLSQVQPPDGVSLAEIVAASAVDSFADEGFGNIPHHLQTIRQRSGDKIHTVFLSSGAICTTGVGTDTDDAMLSLSVAMQKPYEGADSSRSRPFAMKLSNFLPLPPIDFPPPAILPALRAWDEEEGGNDEDRTTSSAFEEFLEHGTGLTLPAMHMDPCVPYRPWPHLLQPLASGVRFVPVHSPPSKSGIASSVRVESSEGVTFQHPATLARHLDPASDVFNWSLLNGLFGMTYGPWGQELIYIRSRLLTAHDFAPNSVTLSSDSNWQTDMGKPTGPHGTGHRLVTDDVAAYGDGPFLAEGLHWQPEPYVEVSELELPAWMTTFIRPGCRVIEGVKCTGDANVPRGTVSFRAFSRGAADDEGVAYFPPDRTQARHAPWDGFQNGPPSFRRADEGGESLDASQRAPVTTDSLFRMTSAVNSVRPSAAQPSRSTTGVTPGRILDCAMGRLAMEGFVNAGIWRRCSVKITSVDELNIHWHALHKVSVAKRLIAC